MVKLSIVIPVYGVEKYIERCLKSVVCQTIKDIEILIINDETQDESMKICKKFASRDERIKIHNKKNEGLGLTRNYGIEKANGKYICFLDSDDFVDKNFYEDLYKTIEETDADASFSEYKIYKNGLSEMPRKGNIPFKTKSVDAHKVLCNMLHVNVKNDTYEYIGMSVWRTIYRTKIIKENKIKFLSEREFLSEDIIFNIQYLNVCDKVSFHKGSYYYYCENNSSLTHTYHENQFERIKILNNQLKKMTNDLKIYNEVEKGLADLFIGNLRATVKSEFDEFGYIKTKSKIKMWLKDDDVQYALKNKEEINFSKQAIFDHYLKKANVLFIYIFCLTKKCLK